jgi:virulence-associated protein VapD
LAAPKRRKYISFDLDTKRLIEEFGENGRSGAYSKIMRFLTRNGFEHKQWSGYVSKEKLSYLEAYLMLDNLMDALPWLTRCTNSLDITDFMTESDAVSYMEKRQADRNSAAAFDEINLFQL